MGKERPGEERREEEGEGGEMKRKRKKVEMICKFADKSVEAEGLRPEHGGRLGNKQGPR